MTAMGRSPGMSLLIVVEDPSGNGLKIGYIPNEIAI
jgi:hypothetical protein